MLIYRRKLLCWIFAIVVVLSCMYQAKIPLLYSSHSLQPSAHQQRSLSPLYSTKYSQVKKSAQVGDVIGNQGYIIKQRQLVSGENSVFSIEEGWEKDALVGVSKHRRNQIHDHLQEQFIDVKHPTLKNNSFTNDMTDIQQFLIDAILGENELKIQQNVNQGRNLSVHILPTQQNSVDKPECTTPNLPDVLIIGAKKAGTRALLKFMDIHPLVKMANQEVHYFDRYYHKGSRWYRRKLPCRMPGQLTVEKTPAYLVSPQAASRVRHLLPKVRLLMVVREPATRALSDYAQSLRHTTHKNFTDLVFSDKATGLVNVNWGPVAGGLYARHLQRWLHYYPPSSLHVVSGENLVQNPAHEMKSVEKFLGLPPFIAPHHFYFNKTKGFQCILKPNLTANETLRLFNDLHLKQIHSQPTQNQLQSSLHITKPMNSTENYPNLQPHCLGSDKGRDHPVIDPDTFKILREFYRPFNYKFFRMIGKSFAWNEVITY